MGGLYWEDWQVGTEFETAARTVTEADIAAFAELSGDHGPLHADEEYARRAGFPGLIAHGPLVYAIAAGLLVQLQLFDGTLIAFLGLDELRFTRPVRPGDTLRARVRVVDRRETSRPDRGVMRRRLQVVNQRGEVVQEGVQAFLVRRRGA